LTKFAERIGLSKSGAVIGKSGETAIKTLDSAGWVAAPWPVAADLDSSPGDLQPQIRRCAAA
jgi:hypothetical protein